MKFALLIAFEFCLIEGKCPGSKLSDKDVQLMLDMHNKYRSQLANGKARMKHGYAPSAKNMYKVVSEECKKKFNFSLFLVRKYFHNNLT